MLAAPGTETIGEPQEVLFVNLVENCHYGLLNDLILQGCDAQWALSSIGFWDVSSLGRLRPIRPPMDSHPGPSRTPSTTDHRLRARLLASGRSSYPAANRW